MHVASSCAVVSDSIQPTGTSEIIIKSTKVRAARMSVGRCGSRVGPFGNVLTNEWVAYTNARINCKQKERVKSCRTISNLLA